MVQLKFVASDGRPLGAINWYAVHGTSMNSSNCLVTSDNVGYASILFEKDVNGGVPPGKVGNTGAGRDEFFCPMRGGVGKRGVVYGTHCWDLIGNGVRYLE